VNTGEWSRKAIEQGEFVGKVNVAASSESSGYDHVPPQSTWTHSEHPAYVHITSNNTIFGTRMTWDPDVPAPLICDASSDFLARPLDMSKYALIYAGAQKNIGPAGVTVVLVRSSFLEKANKGVPTMLDYRVHASKLFNTPPVFAVYMVEKVLRWLKDLGGLTEMERRNDDKARMLYERLDRTDFYRGTARTDSRSNMNVTFRLPDEALEAAFIAGAKKHGLVGLKGHRSVGGIRASIYNACERASVEALVAFMDNFERDA
jgi:phosphoserine aminotransferase